MVRKAKPAIDITGEATANAASTNQKVMRGIGAKIIEIDTRKAAAVAPGKSTRIPDDPIHTLTEEGKLIEPPYDLFTLALLIENNTELNQCVEAMETNIEGFGHRFIPRVKGTPDKPLPKDIGNAVAEEKTRLENFFMYATRESFVKFRRKLRKDEETTGNGYFEVIRNAAGVIQSFAHLPSYQMRLSRVEEKMQKVDRPILELQKDGSVKITKITEWRRFRKYAQSRSARRRNLEISQGGSGIRWYKEFGDERIYDNTTGELAKDGETIPLDKRANEVIHVDLYSARSPYGLPRFIGNLLSIFGDRASEEINYITFRNNNIPSMVVAVSNGQLTEGTIERIESFVESQIQGSDNYSKFLILEAEGLTEGEDGSQIKIDIKPLTDEQHKDALFQNYSDNNQDKIRRAFRLPPIFVGRSDDYTRATAESSRQLADEQVFAPERDEFDSIMNRFIFPDMGIIYHKFRSNSPNTTDNQQLVKILAGAEKTGGMTPKIARLLLEDILGIELPEFTSGYDPNVPFSLTMAEAVKNQADASEPGQQVTALKALYTSIYGNEEDADAAYEATCEKCGNAVEVLKSELSGDPLVDHLLNVHKRIEAKWAEEVGGEDDDDHSHEG